MPISKLAAEAAVSALQKVSSSALFALVKQNPHAFEKHFTKGKAQAAAGADPQGYFKRITSSEVVGKEGYNLLTGNQKARVDALLGGTPKSKDVSKKIGQYNSRHRDDPLTATKTHAVDVSAIFDVVSGVLASAELRQASQHPEERFLAISRVPRGYVGRSVDANGDKAYDCDYAVVVVGAANTSSPRIITVFPANTQYVTSKQLLV